MRTNKIVTKIDELREIVSDWRDGVKPATLEMDLALDRVKEIYEMLRFPNVEVEVVEEPQVEEPIVEAIVEPEIVVEEIVEPEPEPEPEIEEPTAEEEEAERKRERHRRILSLYQDDDEIITEVITESETNKPEPAVEEIEPEPTEQEQHIPEVTPKVVAPIEEPTQLSSSILDTLGYNDRLLLANNLCGGDFEEMRNLIMILGAMPSLDDALIYIAQRYRWCGDNEGAKLLYALLQNRYSQS
ncbi:MAG: hypothetical protein SNF68_00245 [Rikenellaceae bacterium]